MELLYELLYDLFLPSPGPPLNARRLYCVSQKRCESPRYKNGYRVLILEYFVYFPSPFLIRHV